MPLGPSFPDLASLDLFVSVVELGSVSAAARVHGVAQPSASSRLKHLERQVGLQLLDRSPTGTAPTDAGVVFAGWAEQILRSANELQAGLAAFQAEQHGRLRIAASFTIAEYLLPQWLQKFSQEHPADSVALEVANSAHVIERLRAGDADLGFIETPSAIDDLTVRVVEHDQLVAVVAPGHPWAGGTSVPVEALAATPLVTREAGSGTREALEAALTKLGLPAPPSVLELGSTSAFRSAVLLGNSPTVISRLAVAAEIASGELVEVAVEGLTIERDLRAAWPTKHALPPLANDLLTTLDQ